MMEFHCRDVGVACHSVTRAETTEELVAAIARHAKAEHGVELTDTLVDYAKTRIRNSRSRSRE